MDKRFYNVFGPQNESIYVRQSGWEVCIPGYSYGPTVRDFYLLHMVLEGNGVLSTASGVFPAEAGQGFIIYPGETASYRADMKTPWTYAWIGYAGEYAGNMTKLLGATPCHPIFSLGTFTEEIKQIILSIYQDSSTVYNSAMAAIGGLYRLFALLQTANGNRTLQSVVSAHQYYRKAYWYMQEHLGESPKVDAVAAHVGLSRSQLFRVFKACHQESPQQALMRLRLEQAEQLILHSALPIKEVALSVGFSSISNFGKAYRQHFGTTPMAARDAARA